MNTKKLIMILNFVTLVVGCLFGACVYDYVCFRCSASLSYFQFVNNSAYAPLLLIFYVCVAILAKEEIPPKMELSISFLSAIWYFLGTCMMLHLYLKYYNSIRMLVGLTACAALIALHLCVGILHALGKNN